MADDGLVPSPLPTGFFPKPGFPFFTQKPERRVQEGSSPPRAERRRGRSSPVSPPQAGKTERRDGERGPRGKWENGEKERDRALSHRRCFWEGGGTRRGSLNSPSDYCLTCSRPFEVRIYISTPSHFESAPSHLLPIGHVLQSELILTLSKYFSLTALSRTTSTVSRLESRSRASKLTLPQSSFTRCRILFIIYLTLASL